MKTPSKNICANCGKSKEAHLFNDGNYICKLGENKLFTPSKNIYSSDEGTNLSLNELRKFKNNPHGMTILKGKPVSSSDTSGAENQIRSESPPANSNEILKELYFIENFFPKLTPKQFKEFVRLVKKALSKKEEEYLSKLRELKYYIENEYEVGYILKEFNDLFPKLKEEKSP